MRLSKKQWFVMQALALLIFTGGVLLARPYLARAVGVTPSVANGMTGDGSLFSPYLVENCQNLQDMTMALGANYRLANNIDCSATSSWNSGAGFIPVGNSDNFFSGSLDGRNHTISDITINNSQGEYRETGLFGWINGASVLNLRIADAIILGNASLYSSSIGGLAGISRGDSIVDHIVLDGTISFEGCDKSPYIGGLIGNAGDTHIYSSSTSGSLTLSGTSCGNYGSAVGGLMGLAEAAIINNSHADMSIIIDGSSTTIGCPAHDCRFAGGLIGLNNTYSSTTVQHSYAAGSISITNDSGSPSYLIGGILGLSLDDNIYITSSFSATQVNVVDYTTVGGIAGEAGSSLTVDSYYDNTLNPASSCVSLSALSGCAAVNSDGLDANHFKDNNSAAPLDQWDFANQWQTATGNLPSLQSDLRTIPKVTSLSTLTSSSNTIDVSWVQPPVLEPDVSITSFEVACKISGATDWSVCAIINDGNATSASITGLEVETQYDFKVIAVGTHNLYSEESDIVQGNDGVIPPATDLETTILSTSSIELTWTQADPPDINLSIESYEVLCRKTSDASYTTCATISNPSTHSATITGLESSTQYSFMIMTHGSLGSHKVGSSETTGTTGTPGFALISNCQQLQDMRNDLASYYELAKNIDCSDTITWNGGRGFEPIGVFDPLNSSIQWFSGIFTGNNYSISNLYCNRSDNFFSSCALFLTAGDGAIMQDVKINASRMHGVYTSAGLVGVMSHATISNVQINDLLIDGDGLIAGGVAGGITNAAGGLGGAPISVQKTSVNGSINLTDGPSNVGGFAGIINSNGHSQIRNNYANVAIVSDAVTMAGGFSSTLFVKDTDVVENNYAAGSIASTSTDPNINHAPLDGSFIDVYNIAGGFTGLLVDTEPAPATIRNNFAHVALSSVNPEYAPGGFVAASGTDHDLSSNYFDADQADTSTCQNPGSATTITCNSVTGQPNYFKNNSTNAPLDTWDFTNIWMTTAEFPVFGTNVTSSISTIPADRLPGSGGGTNNTAGDGQATNPQTTGAAGTIGGRVNSEQTAAPEGGLLGAIKNFVRSLPAGVIVAFPYALFGLLFIATMVLLIELWRELRRIQALQVLINKQRLLAEERDAFWHLAANYLRAPVTLIVGGAEALHEAGITPVTTSLQGLAAGLQKTIADIMAKIEGSTSLQAISQVQPRQKAQVALRAMFIVPVVTIALLAVLGNYAAASFRGMNPGTLGYLSQIVGFVITTILFYWILSLLTNSKSRRHATEVQLERQTSELANARHELINNTAGSLNPDLTALEGTLKQLSPNQAASNPAKTLTEGTSRLRDIVRSFTLLIKVQEGTGAVSTTPEASTTDLSNILSRTRAKLTPQIIAKRLQVSAPAVPLAVAAEADLANQVLDSIISNAVDYSPEGGTVKVEARKLQDKIQLRISDEGQGINKTQLDHLFQPFVRTDGKSAMDMSHGGFGINLYLDKLIMEQMGGSITAASTPGKGTSFTLTWPA